ncbi:hypothetical protein RintRC_5283 [Richelia intracellularis]|nr:hypothetical protein RintRC_5283 [Richelia intracellularis]
MNILFGFGIIRPWTQRVDKHKKIIQFWKKDVIPGFNLIKKFKISVYVGDVLDSKKAALNEHKSQIRELIPHPH